MEKRNGSSATDPQHGIFALGTIAHYFLEFDVKKDVPLSDVVGTLAQLRQPAVAAGGVNLVLAFGSRLWQQIAPKDVPSSLQPFAEIARPDGRRAPSTQHDFWLWISGSSTDVVFEHVRAAAFVLKDVMSLAAERSCFVHRDSRDLTGFIDGTANPSTLAAPSIALVPAGQPGAGGSHVLAMRWVHDLEAFDALPTHEQERVFGRSRPESLELQGADKPPTAHIARVQIADADGREMQIYRRSVPYGTVAEHGLYFVAFSQDPTRFRRMLARMFGASGDGLHDRLTDFSKPVSGAFYFAPSLTLLAELANEAAAIVAGELTVAAEA